MTGRRVWEEPWPQADPALLVGDEIQLVVQLNGKLIDRLPAPARGLERPARGDRSRLGEARLTTEREGNREGSRGARQARQLRRPMSARPKQTRVPVGPAGGRHRRRDAAREPLPRLVRGPHGVHRVRVGRHPARRLLAADRRAARRGDGPDQAARLAGGRVPGGAVRARRGVHAARERPAGRRRGQRARPGHRHLDRGRGHDPDGVGAVLALAHISLAIEPRERAAVDHEAETVAEPRADDPGAPEKS